MANNAFVETTILTDILLKPGVAANNKAKAALNRFDVTELPVYAIKEFKAGPLSHFVWMHNKFVQQQSFSRALEALHAMSRTPKRNTTSTAIEALRTAAYLIGKQAFENDDLVQCDLYRFAIKTAIYKAWKRRRKVTTRVVQELECYNEVQPVEINGLIELESKKCEIRTECSLAGKLKSRPDILRKLEKASADQRTPEGQRRKKVLHELIRKPKTPMTEKMCRDLGDAVFAFFAPVDSTILTTNLKDHEPLAGALGKKAERP